MIETQDGDFGAPRVNRETEVQMMQGVCVSNDSIGSESSSRGFAQNGTKESSKERAAGSAPTP
jgi:hypothetical protein